MRLLVPVYHRATIGRYGNSPEMLDEHFAYVARTCCCVLPGDFLDPHRVNVCLSFDDAYYDFYSVVFPLLKKHGLRALLAVSPNFIGDAVALPAARRLELSANVDGEDAPHEAFCSWPELSEMAASDRVRIAAHGFSHIRLDGSDADLHTEIVVPQTLLAARTGKRVESFVFPYGRFSPRALSQVKKCYRYAFRIGSADNSGWDRQILYRINADQMSAPDALLARPRLVVYTVRRRWNTLRGR